MRTLGAIYGKSVSIIIMNRVVNESEHEQLNKVFSHICIKYVDADRDELEVIHDQIKNN